MELKQEVRQLRQERDMVQSMHPHNGALGHPSQPPTPMEHYPPEYSRGLPVRAEPRAELPPLRSIGGNMPPASDSMTGIQYQHDMPHANGYRPAYPTRI
jgi:hypothetical protein